MAERRLLETTIGLDILLLRRWRDARKEDEPEKVYLSEEEEIKERLRRLGYMQ